MRVRGAAELSNSRGIWRHENGAFVAIAIIPLVVYLAVFLLFPALYALYLSLHQTAFLRTERFVGLSQYVSIFQDWRFGLEVVNTLVFTLGSVVVCFAFGFLFAWTLNEAFPLRYMFRVLLILPWVANQVAFTLLVKWVFNADYGVWSALLRQLGLSRFDPLSDQTGAMIALILANSWRMVGYSIIFNLAALQTVPTELTEAAQVDGATTLQRITRVIIPLLRPQMLVIIVLLTLKNFNILTPVMVLTGGGPGVATETLGLRMYNEAFINYALDRSAAYSVLILALNVVFTVLYSKAIHEKEGAQ